MRYQVNLASKPFQNRSLFWLGILAGFGIVAFLALQITASSAEMAAEAETLKDKTNQQNTQIGILKDKQPKFTAVNVSQENYEMLAAAHELVGRKALSWTALLSEMEKIMPHDVRLLNISVLRTAADKGERRSASEQTVVNWLSRKVPLTLELATKDDKKITEELLPALNKQSDRYSAFVVQQQPQPETSELIFKIEVDYTPPFTGTAAAPPAPVQGGQQ
jgi:hypothetical protein